MRPVITSTPPMSPRHPSGSLLLALFALLAAMLSYQCGAALAKHLFPLVGAQGATAYRLGLGALIMLAIRRPWRKRRPSANPRVLWAYGLSMGAMNLVFYLALRTIPLGIAVAIEFCGPLVIAMLGMRRWADCVWIALAIGGLLLLLPFHGQLHALDPMGVFYAALAGVG